MQFFDGPMYDTYEYLLNSQNSVQCEEVGVFGS